MKSACNEPETQRIFPVCARSNVQRISGAIHGLLRLANHAPTPRQGMMFRRDLFSSYPSLRQCVRSLVLPLPRAGHHARKDMCVRVGVWWWWWWGAALFDLLPGGEIRAALGPSTPCLPDQPLPLRPREPPSQGLSSSSSFFSFQEFKVAPTPAASCNPGGR